MSFIIGNIKIKKCGLWKYKKPFRSFDYFQQKNRASIVQYYLNFDISVNVGSIVIMQYFG